MEKKFSTPFKFVSEGRYNSQYTVVGVGVVLVREFAMNIQTGRHRPELASEYKHDDIVL